ncbi:Long-chain-alcohol oxidase FAO4A [Apostasia shenzhenica]|uniref:Long-chain-alcohol oxidase n=1 Tax=Apostasia shenzhenica TaxID=1088818 RepID=A0A2I0AZ14_9ASPA|nr:Long-chain-alcohol oxidase FAO4A [Apostasia shenzhenica]
MAGILGLIAGLVSGGLRHPQMVTLRWALQILATWYGTLLLCGRLCLSAKFPFVRRFAALEQDKREKILRSWASSSFLHLRMMYVCLKCVTLRHYFSKVNEKNENPSWKAIGYCGPDGGSVVAGVLADAGYKVLVLEKGNYFSRSDLSLLEGPTCTEMYEGGGIIATDNVAVVILAGSTVGGGSAINWSASIRTPDNVRREWCEVHRLPLFGSRVFDKALDVVCRRMGVQSHVEKEGFNNAVLRRGCAAAGFPISDVPCNAPPEHYCGWCHLGCRDGKKQSSLETWLADMASSGNGLVLPGCRASGSRAEALQFQIKSKVTVVAGGALNTPQLLKRSGLKNKHVGKNLHLHPTVMAWGYFPERSYEGGILTSMATVGAAGSAIIQTPALHPGMYSALVPWLSAADFRQRMRRFARTAHVFALVRDEGSGTVDYPGSVTHRLTGRDEKRLREGLVAAVRVMAAAGAEEVGTQNVGGEKDEVEEMVKGVRRRRMGDLRTPLCSAHQMGSCRMGASPENGAVSPEGEAWEVEGLFVTDGSVIPTAVGVNPMVTVQAIAYCVAQNVVQHLQGKKTA